MAYANETRDWRIYADFANYLIHIARPLYADDEIGVALKETVYALDSTTIDLSIGLFPWARFRKTKAAVKMHTLLDLHGPIPSFIDITEGKVHDVNILDRLPVEPGAFYIMDRGYLDFARLSRLERASSFFVIRAKRGFQFDRISSEPVDQEIGLRCDQTILLKGFYPSKAYPFHLRRIKYYDKEEDRRLIFLTNNFLLPPILIADLYRCRWQIELFFKWIKQHLRIKAFYGTSQNAVKTQIWIAVAVYVIVTIMKKRLRLAQSMYEILQILSLTLFEKMPLYQLFTKNIEIHGIDDSCIQLEFNLL
jgi:IS4 transposase